MCAERFGPILLSYHRNTTMSAVLFYFIICQGPKKLSSSAMFPVVIRNLMNGPVGAYKPVRIDTMSGSQKTVDTHDFVYWSPDLLIEINGRVECGMYDQPVTIVLDWLYRYSSFMTLSQMMTSSAVGLALFFPALVHICLLFLSLVVKANHKVC